MTLNFSHRPIFPAHLSEDNLVSPIRIANGRLMEGIPERAGDEFARPWRSCKELQDCFDYGGGSIDRVDSQESVSKDILDLLPADPFGMDISSTFTAITGWIEDLEDDYGVYTRANVCKSKVDCSIFAELNLIWNKAVEFQAFPENPKLGDVVVADRIGGSFEEELCHGGVGDVCSTEVIHLGSETARIHQNQSSQKVTGLCAPYDAGLCVNVDSGVPHLAMAFSFAYLGVRDLLLVERVCKSWCYTVKNDPLLWKSIHIDQPLNDCVTDDILLQLTNRAQGNLQCLSLVECPRITDVGLKRVLESNLRLTKLSVPGCTRLSVDGIIHCLKDFNTMATTRIKHLRIGRIYGVTQNHFNELKSLLGIDDHMPSNNQKPLFYHRGNFYLSFEDDRAIDIEICPRCQNPRLVYDCPPESCHGENHAAQDCRACTLCIARCAQCGRCINGTEYEETFCLDLLCSSCWKQQIKISRKARCKAWVDSVNG
ncbi:hypothetical protein Nepgr_032931 [Nepenthes gracilis]|uniref:F-box domain-containing protein n=1 Tax=Nepenthes gracilis TaxID=150966 RepID=A0AAD3TLC8_NEPGR|nr:hypothetical protein Nepgr_032931 [Nepenthes gracilis]